MGVAGRLGFWEVFAIGVGGMIGGGIFAVLGLSLELADGAAALAFALAGLVALLTAYSYAKLSARYPSEGGTIEFLVQAYGDGLLSGGLNVMLLASYIVMVALYAHAFASYGASLVAGGGAAYHAAYVGLAVFVVASLTFVNALGARASGRLELALVAFKLAVLVFVSVVALGLVDWARLSPSRWPGFASIVAGGMIIFLAYEGFELVANAAGDVENTTVLRRALYASVATVIAVYILVAVVASGALTPEQVEQARDYALAVLVEPVLGAAGFALVVAAALASTGSAINATLYGTARMSYMVAKYGQLPRALGRRVWRGAYEGLIVISALSLALALGAGLESISAAGSGGFLIVFTAVNLAAYRLRRQTGASPAVTLAGAALAAAALAVLTARMAQLNPRHLAVLAAMIAGSFTLEALYRRLTGRRIARPLDPRLAERERLIRTWHEWLPRLAREAARLLREAEVHLIGSLARGEHERAGDVDVLIVTSRPLTRGERRRVERALAEALGLPPHHPLHIHWATPRERERYLKRGASRRLA